MPKSHAWTAWIGERLPCKRSDGSPFCRDVRYASHRLCGPFDRTGRCCRPRAPFERDAGSGRVHGGSRGTHTRADPDRDDVHREGARREGEGAREQALGDEATRARLRESTYEPRRADPSAVVRCGWQDFRIKVTDRHPERLERTRDEFGAEQGRDGTYTAADLTPSSLPIERNGRGVPFLIRYIARCLIKVPLRFSLKPSIPIDSTESLTFWIISSALLISDASS